MGDFGRILDERESIRRSGARASKGSREQEETTEDRKERSHARERREWLERQLDRYPVVDKDAILPEAEDSNRHTVRPDRLPVDGRLDLHGFTVEEALFATERFIESAVARGLRKVVVIHGKGRNGEGILKREVRSYLERHPSTGAMGYGKGAEGGRGALWVVLRNRGR